LLDSFHSRHLQRFGRVKLRHFSAKYGRTRHHRGKHSRNNDVQAKLRRAIRLGRSVQSPRSFSNQREILGILQRHICRRRQLRCCVCQRSIRRTLAGRRVNHTAVFHAASRRLHAPLRGCRFDEHHSRRRSHLAVSFPFRWRSCAPAGHLHSKRRVVIDFVHRRCFDADFRPIRLQLLVQKHRQRSINSLSHFRVRGNDGYAFVCPDSNERIQRNPFFFRGKRAA